MRFPRALRRLFRPERSDKDKKVEARYAAAAELERKTQSHYRSVTGVDSEGRTTKSDRKRP